MPLCRLFLGFVTEQNNQSGHRDKKLHGHHGITIKTVVIMLEAEISMIQSSIDVANTTNFKIKKPFLLIHIVFLIR